MENHPNADRLNLRLGDKIIELLKSGMIAILSKSEHMKKQISRRGKAQGSQIQEKAINWDAERKSGQRMDKIPLSAHFLRPILPDRCRNHNVSNDCLTDTHLKHMATFSSGTRDEREKQISAAPPASWQSTRCNRPDGQSGARRARGPRRRRRRRQR